MGTNNINVNGKTIKVEGDNVFIQTINGKTKVLVDGEEVFFEENKSFNNELIIKWEGDLASLTCNSVEVTGKITGDVDCVNLTCGAIEGDVDATNVNCKNIIGNVDATTVTCTNVSGKINM